MLTFNLSINLWAKLGFSTAVEVKDFTLFNFCFNLRCDVYFSWYLRWKFCNRYTIPVISSLVFFLGYISSALCWSVYTLYLLLCRLSKERCQWLQILSLQVWNLSCHPLFHLLAWWDWFESALHLKFISWATYSCAVGHTVQIHVKLDFLDFFCLYWSSVYENYGI